ncbi:MAG: hypothetical protein ACI4IG_00250 [Eubacterium sp.]
MKKEYMSPEVDIIAFTISSSVYTTSGFGWEEEEDEYGYENEY